jgi:hypothetical protein
MADPAVPDLFIVGESDHNTSETTLFHEVAIENPANATGSYIAHDVLASRAPGPADS